MKGREGQGANSLEGFRIAFVVPPPPTEGLYGEWNLSRVDSVSPPLGLLLLCSMVRRHGGIPSIHDGSARLGSSQAIIAEVLATNPDAVGITSVTPSFPQAKALIENFLVEAPGLPLILGGPHITARPEQVMQQIPGLNIGVLREGELTLIELLEALRSGRDLLEVKGLIFRTDGRIFRTPERELIQNLDSLPFPAWDLLPDLTTSYRLSVIGTRSTNSTSLVTTRGCPGRCSFCDTGGVGRTVRGYSALYVLGMLEELIEKHRIKDFVIYDDNFPAMKKRLQEICREIVRHGWDISWSCSARVDMVDPESLQLMRAAGCWQIEYGIETGVSAILAAIGKKITLGQVRKALRWTKEAGIETRGNFIFGFPGETRQTLEETIRFALSLDLDYFQQTFLTPFPGSRIFEGIERYGAMDPDLGKMNNLVINFVPNGLTKQTLIRMSSKAFRKFYLRPRIILHNLRKFATMTSSGWQIKDMLFTFFHTIFRGKGKEIVRPEAGAPLRK